MTEELKHNILFGLMLLMCLALSIETVAALATLDVHAAIVVGGAK